MISFFVKDELLLTNFGAEFVNVAAAFTVNPHMTFNEVHAEMIAYDGWDDGQRVPERDTHVLAWKIIKLVEGGALYVVLPAGVEYGGSLC